ncbi:MAG TPA: iron ABC transporter permease, partial [bacterium]
MTLRKHVPLFILLLPISFILIAYVLFPNLQVLVQSFTSERGLTADYYREFFNVNHPSSMLALWGSIYVSLLTVVFSGIVGVLLAYVFTHYTFPGRAFFSALAALPVVMPPLVGVLAFLFLFGESGILPRFLQALFGMAAPPFALSGMAAILVVHTYSMYVYFYLFASTAFSELDVSVMEAAQNL